MRSKRSSQPDLLFLCVTVKLDWIAIIDVAEGPRFCKMPEEVSKNSLFFICQEYHLTIRQNGVCMV